MDTRTNEEALQGFVARASVSTCARTRTRSATERTSTGSRCCTRSGTTSGHAGHFHFSATIKTEEFSLQIVGSRVRTDFNDALADREREVSLLGDDFESLLKRQVAQASVRNQRILTFRIHHDHVHAFLVLVVSLTSIV